MSIMPSMSALASAAVRASTGLWIPQILTGRGVPCIGVGATSIMPSKSALASAAVHASAGVRIPQMLTGGGVLSPPNRTV